MRKGNNMPKAFLFLMAFAATTVFAAPEFRIYRGENYLEQHGAVVGCTQKNADKYALETVVVEDRYGNERSLPVKTCLELNKRGQVYHTIRAVCSYIGCIWTGYEEWYDYDKNGNKIHSKDSEGFEVWRDYYKSGKIKRRQDKVNSRILAQIEYDENGKETYYKDGNGYETWYYYDKNGKRTHSKDSDGFVTWYDKNGNITHYYKQ